MQRFLPSNCSSCLAAIALASATTLLLAAPTYADLDTSRLRAAGVAARQPENTDFRDAQTQFAEAVRYANGDGVPRDSALALRWFTRAAEQGHAEAAASLAIMYNEGQGTAVDQQRSVSWARRGSQRGSLRATYSLGLAYYHGHGVDRDLSESFKWYQQAADGGYAPAMNNLGIMYGLGEGVARDDVQAYAWFIASASRGDQNAEQNRDLTRAELDDRSRAKGETIAEQLRARLP